MELQETDAQDGPTIPDKKEDYETDDNNAKCANNADDHTNNSARYWNTHRCQHAKHFNQSTVLN